MSHETRKCPNCEASAYVGMLCPACGYHDPDTVVHPWNNPPAFAVIDSDEPAWVLWWRDQSEVEIEAMRPKVTDYGAIDLLWIGRAMAETMGRNVQALSDEECYEMGCYWYVLGKMGRWAAAVVEGRRPTDDTVGDIGIYARMVLRTRAAGGWPNGR